MTWVQVLLLLRSSTHTHRHTHTHTPWLRAAGLAVQLWLKPRRAHSCAGIGSCHFHAAGSRSKAQCSAQNIRWSIAMALLHSLALLKVSEFKVTDRVLQGLGLWGSCRWCLAQTFTTDLFLKCHNLGFRVVGFPSFWPANFADILTGLQNLQVDRPVSK